jgi:heme/copper-type cytochrome/quinol oxidase subunit 2
MRSMNWRQWLLLIGVGLLIIFLPIPSAKASPLERVFYLDASRFQYNPAVLRVNRGDKVTIVLSTSDVMHGLSIDGYNVQTMTQPTRKGSVTFIANRTGVFRFHCTVVCGNMHPFMTGKLVVGQNTLLLRSAALLGLVMFAGVWMLRK